MRIRARSAVYATALFALLSGILPAHSGPAAVDGCANLSPAAVAEDPVRLSVCQAVIPGQLYNLTSQDGDARSCLFGFAFRGNDRRTYFSSHGSCYLGACLELLGIKLPVCVLTDYSDEEPVFAPGKGIEVRREGGGNRIGELVYAVFDGTYDFSLIRLDKDIPFSPQACGTGGPTGINTDVTTDPTVLQIARVGLSANSLADRGMYHQDHFGSVRGFPASDGSPVLTEAGEAVGITVPVLEIGLERGGAWVQRTTKPLARASARTGLKLSLMTAPLL